jgi:hypothetical protein
VNHSDIKKHLADYLEGDLGLDKRALVDAHLDDCGECSVEVDQMQQTIGLLRTLPEPEPPPMIAANVMRRIRSGDSQLGFWGRIGRAFGGVLEPSFVLPASAIAAAALVVTVIQGVGGLDRVRMVVGASSEASSNASIASLPSPTASRRSDTSSAAAAMDFVARVERRATQSDRGRSAVRDRSAATASRLRSRSTDSTIAYSSTPRRPRASDVLRANPQIPEMWAVEFSRVMSATNGRVRSPGTLVAAKRYASADAAAATSGEWPQAAADGPGNSDPRDAWLALGFEDPAEFARYIAGRNLAEQELWTVRLSERAMERGLLAEFLHTLRASGDATADWVAADFEARATSVGTIITPAETPLGR